MQLSTDLELPSHIARKTSKTFRHTIEFNHVEKSLHFDIC